MDATKRYLRMIFRLASYKKLVMLIYGTSVGFVLYEFFITKKTIVYVISTQRSGSTLLKALLAEGSDVSNIPEFNFSEFSQFNKYYSYYRYCKLSSRRIIVLKCPASLLRNLNYPKLHWFRTGKIIVLIRDVLGTIRSIKKMGEQSVRAKRKLKKWDDSGLAEEYWCHVYENIDRAIDIHAENVRVVRYEDLVSNPLRITSKLFSFIGSDCRQGVETYRMPENYEWEWGLDDGGEIIKTLKVQKNNCNEPIIQNELEETACRSERVSRVREMYGYGDKEVINKFYKGQ